MSASMKTVVAYRDDGVSEIVVNEEFRNAAVLSDAIPAKLNVSQDEEDGFVCEADFIEETDADDFVEILNSTQKYAQILQI